MCLIISYWNCYMACITSTPVTTTFDELDKTTNDFPLKVMTMDSTTYYFDADMYRFLGDTLDGLARIDSDSQRVKISEAEILSVNIGTNKNQSSTGWILLVLGISTAFFVLINVFSEFEDDI